MRRTKSLTLELDDKSTLDVIVYEVRPLDFMELHSEIQTQRLPIGEYERLLPLCVNLTKDQLKTLYPGEIEQIVDAWKEVNSAFLSPWPTIKKIIERVGLGEWLASLLQESGMLENLKTALSLDLQKVFASLPTADTEIPSSTDGGTSELH